MYRSVILALFLGLSFQSIGQKKELSTTEEKRAIIYLKGGSELEVIIVDWDFEKGITAVTQWGQEMFFPKEKVHKVKSFSNHPYFNQYRFKEKGVYYSLFGGMIASNHGQRLNETNGYSLSFSSGYRFHRLFSVGLGTGFDQYAHKSGEKVHPIFVDLRSYLFRSNTTFVANLQAGYSLAFDDELRGITNSRGGLMLYPNIGLSFGQSETKYSLDIGYKFQRVNWTYSSRWDVREQTEYRLNYKRFVIRFGIVL